MKTPQLQELVRMITRQVLKEYSTMMSTADKMDAAATGQNTDTPPTDAMTSSEKAKAERDAKRQADAEMRATKMVIDKQDAFYKAQVTQDKLKKTSLTKKLQDQQSGKSTSLAGAGTIPA